MVHYVMGDLDTESEPHATNFAECRLVLVAHDEMTAQANEAQPKTWVFENQHRLRKKGPGRGIHQSDVICSTVGWLEKASQTMEYGKNYDVRKPPRLRALSLDSLIPRLYKASSTFTNAY